MDKMCKRCHTEPVPTRVSMYCPNCKSAVLSEHMAERGRRAREAKLAREKAGITTAKSNIDPKWLTRGSPSRDSGMSQICNGEA